MVRRRQVVVITGASAGVGRALARRYARDGARIVLIARGRAGLDAARREVESLGGEALAVAADVADAGALERAARQAEERFGPIDIWINNAMAAVFSRAEEMTPDEFRRVTEVSYLGQVYGALAALRRMRQRNAGTIVFVGSALAYRGIPLQSAYSAAKHAVQGFMESLRSELLHDDSAIRVTMVQLPALNTPQFDWVKSRLQHKAQPVPPIYQPEVAAEGIYFAAQAGRRELNVGISTSIAVTGNKLAPGLGDWYLARTGFASQQTGEAEDAGRAHNLWEPVDERRDFGAHGRFDSRSADYSLQLWLNKHRGALLAGAVIAAAAGALLRRALRPPRPDQAAFERENIAAPENHPYLTETGEMFV